MPLPYSLLVIGQATDRNNLSLDDATYCWQQVSIALYSSLKALNHLSCTFVSNDPSGIAALAGYVPRTDGVLFWGSPQVWSLWRRSGLKRITRCRALVVMFEGPVTREADWQFVLSGDGPRTTRIHAPVWKSLYRQCVKTQSSVLIDHWMQDNDWDWTYRIEEWLECVAAEFSITQYVSDEPHTSPASRNGIGRPRFKQMRTMPFPQWLRETDHLESFIVTHYESYGYALLDMFARGTRVLCPTPFVPPHFRDRFHFETFSNKEELLTALRRAPIQRKLESNRANVTAWADAAKQIDDRFQSLLTC